MIFETQVLLGFGVGLANFIAGYVCGTLHKRTDGVTIFKPSRRPPPMTG